MVIVVMVLGIGPVVHWAYTVQPQPRIDGRAELIALTARGQPEGTNAWPLWIEAFDILKEVEEDIRARGYPPRNDFDEPPSFWQVALFSDFDFENMKPEADAIELLRERGFFELTAHAAAAPRAVFEGYPMGPVALWGAGNYIGDDWTGYLSSVRRITEIQLALMRLAAREQDWETFLRCLDEALVGVRQIMLQPLSIDFLIAPSVRGRIDEHLNYFLDEGALPEPVLAEIADRLAPHSRASQLQRLLDAEKIAIREFVDHTYENTEAGGRFIPTALNQWQRTRAELAQASRDWLKRSGVHSDDVRMPSRASRLSNIGAYRLPNRSDVEAFIENTFLRLNQWTMQLPLERAANPFNGRAVDQELAEHFGWTSGPFEQLERTVGLTSSFAVRSEATRILVGIRRFQLENAGAVPIELGELVPQFLDAIPIDPSNGQEFVYRRTDDEFGFVIYSMGLDGEDNGGEEGEHYALIDLELGKGFDAVFGREVRPSSNRDAGADKDEE
jgi:hypothetical protein